MVAVLNIIAALGINSSLWYQLAIFVVTFFMLRQFVFLPYFVAYQGRQGQIRGDHTKAEQIFAQTRELETHYQRKARGLTAEIKAIYNNAKQDAVKEQERIQVLATQKAKNRLEASRARIQEEYIRAREELAKQAPEFGHAISLRLLSSQATGVFQGGETK